MIEGEIVDETIESLTSFHNGEDGDAIAMEAIEGVEIEIDEFGDYDGYGDKAASAYENSG